LSERKKDSAATYLAFDLVYADDYVDVWKLPPHGTEAMRSPSAAAYEHPDVARQWLQFTFCHS